MPKAARIGTKFGARLINPSLTSRSETSNSSDTKASVNTMEITIAFELSSES